MAVTLIKHLVKLLKRVFLIFFGAIIIYFIVALITSNISTSPKDYTNKDKRIYVASNGVHSDIIIPVQNISNQLKSRLLIDESTNYMAFGWGDKGFFINTPTWGDLTLSVAIKAVFLDSPTAMHLTPYKKIGLEWKSVQLSELQLSKINELIYNSFQINTDRNFIEIKGYSYGMNDRFYEAIGSYSCLFTCNTWTNSVLKSSDIKTAIWTPFDFGVLKHL